MITTENNQLTRPVETSDSEIIELYWARDEQAIRLTDKKYGDYLYVIAYNVLHDRLDCEECLNDTYNGTWNSIPPSKPKLFQAFISKIMRNVATDRYRRNSAAKRIPSELTVSLDELDECFGNSADLDVERELSLLSRVLNSYLESLSPRQEFIFVCRYYYADKVEHIAKMLELGTATVYRDLKTIREGLKKRLEEEGYRV